MNVGDSDDGTLEKLKNWAARESKIRIVESVWPMNDPEKQKRGLILSEMTNLALEACQNDWCIYLQSDEILHEDDLPAIRQALEDAALHPDL